MEALLAQYAEKANEIANQATKIAEQEAHKKFKKKYAKRIRILKSNSKKKAQSLNKLTEDYNSIIVKLEEAKLEHEREKEEFIKHERKNMTTALKSMGEFQLVNLNVGGKKFTTTINTLTKYEDSMFPVLLSGKFKENPANEIFIDRDGQAFKYIMTFLRNGEYIAPSDPAMQKLVNCEIEYYGLTCLLNKNPTVKPTYYGINNFFPYEAYFTNEFKQIRKDENKIRSDKCNLSDPDKCNLSDLNLSDPFLIKIFEEEYNPLTNPQENQEIIGFDPELRNQSRFDIVSEKEFGERFAKYSNNLFDGFKWNNVCVAGGSVVRCLLKESEFGSNSDSKSNLEKGTDIDLFIYGLTKEECITKAMEIYNYLRAKSGGDIFWIRTIHALTICLKYPNKHIQIVLRTYKDIADILTTFDLDSCCVAFSGTQILKGISVSNVVCTPRFKHAITYQTNIVDPKRQSETYEFRLYKYKSMGFSITVPGYSRDMVNPNTNLKSLWSTNGLRRLLILKYYEQLTGDGMNATRCECEYVTNEKLQDTNFDPPTKSDYFKQICRHHKNSSIVKLCNGKDFQPHTLVAIDNIDKLKENEIEDPKAFSDYCNTFIPHGVLWEPVELIKLYTKRIEAMMFGGSKLTKVSYIFYHQGRVDRQDFDISETEINEMTNYDNVNIEFTIPAKMEFEEPTIGKEMRGSFHPTHFDYYGDVLSF